MNDPHSQASTINNAFSDLPANQAGGALVLADTSIPGGGDGSLGRPVLPQHAADFPAGGAKHPGSLRTSRKTRATPRARPPAPWASSPPDDPKSYRRSGADVRAVLALRAIDDPVLREDGERLYVGLRVEQGYVGFDGEFTTYGSRAYFEIFDFEAPGDVGRKLSEIKRGEIFFALLFDTFGHIYPAGSSCFSRFATHGEWKRYNDLVFGR